MKDQSLHSIIQELPQSYVEGITAINDTSVLHTKLLATRDKKKQALILARIANLNYLSS